jgi:hypothetical protein
VLKGRDLEGWTVLDEGAVAEEAALVFHLHSPAPFLIQGDRVIAGTEGRRIEIIAPWAVRSAERIALIDCNYRPIHHLQLWSRPVTAFSLLTTFRRVL